MRMWECCIIKKWENSTCVLCLVFTTAWCCGALHAPTTTRPSWNQYLLINLFYIFPALNFETTNLAQSCCFWGTAWLLSNTRSCINIPLNDNSWIIQGNLRCNCSFLSVGKFPVFLHQSCFEEMMGARGSAEGNIAVSERVCASFFYLGRITMGLITWWELLLLYLLHLSHQEMLCHITAAATSTAASNNSIPNSVMEESKVCVLVGVQWLYRQTWRATSVSRQGRKNIPLCPWGK